MMRRKEKLFSKSRDETDDVVNLIQQSDSESYCTKETIISKLMQIKNINEDTAKANVDCALCIGTIVLIRDSDGKAILKDAVSLKRERSLSLKCSTDLSSIVLQSMTELGARSESHPCSSTAISSHIRNTYDIKPKNVDIGNVVERAIERLYERRLIFTIDDDNYIINAEINGHYNGAVGSCFPSTSAVSMESSADTQKPKRNSKGAAKKDPPSMATGKGELRQLQDSLSQFFTPSSVRRSRLTSMSSISENYRRSVEKTEEKNEDSKPLNKALEIVIDDSAPDISAPITTSSEGSVRSGGMTGSSATPSPHRRTDQLQDALSMYFSATTDRRRRHEKGEYFVMSNGITPRRKIDSNEDIHHVHRIDTIKEEEENVETIDKQPNGFQRRTVSPNRALKTPDSPSNIQKRRTSTRISANVRSVRKRKDPPKGSFAKRKASKLLKNAKGAFRQNSNGESSTASNSPKKGINTHFKNGKLQSETASMVNRTMLSPINSTKVSPFKAFSPPELTHTESGWQIPDEDRKMFDQARELAQKELQKSCMQILTAKNENSIYPVRIKIANYEIDSWYSSPYPQEYITLPIVYICESCLTYLVDEAPHARKCTLKFPPGNEIYRCNNLSVFEVDGNLARVYCRNLCLLAKLFIDHKTLYFDVEPFLFYVLTVNDEKGNHFVGYFSKEKFSSQKYNLACIVTLPCYQGSGYGRFLIDFSYLLSRRENMLGTPERPLSELGRIAYQRYWRSALLEELYRCVIQSPMKALSINDLSQQTGITLHDVLDTLICYNLVRVVNNMLAISVNVQQLKNHWLEAKSNNSRIWLDESCLRWTPKQYSPSKEFPLRSPAMSSPMKKETSETDMEKVKTNRRGRKKLVLSNPPMTELIIRRQRKSSAKADKRRKQMEEEFLSDDEDDDFHLSSMVSCKEDVVTKSNRRKTPSTDDEMPENEKPSGSRIIEKNRCSYEVSKAGKVSKSRRFSNTSARRESKKSSVVALSSSDNDDDKDVALKARNSNSKCQLVKNKIYSSTEGEDNTDDDDSSSVYGEPKRKNSNYTRRRKQSSGLRTSKGTHKWKRKTWQNNEKKSHAKENEVLKASTQDVRSTRDSTPNDENIRSSSSNSGDDSDSDNSSLRKTKTYDKAKSSSKRFDERPAPPDAMFRRYVSDVDEQDDDVCTASSISSMSPQPIHDRRSLKNCNRKNVPDTINMGGEPDTVNMGGEPDQDITSVPTMNVLSPDSPKAPLAPPANIIEDDEQMEDDDIQTEGFFSNQTTSNRSVMESSSHASFDQVLSHRSYDNVAEEYHISSYQQQPQQSQHVRDTTLLQKTDASCMALQSYNYPYVPTTSSFASFNKCGGYDVTPSSFFNTNNSYYAQPQSHFSSNSEMKANATYIPTQLQQVEENIVEQWSDPSPMVVEDKGESDMPILDARTTPRSSPSLVHMEQSSAKKLGDEEDDDDAPPQLSPNVPSNEVQPMTPGENDIPEEGLLHNIESLPSVVNMSVDSVAAELNNDAPSISNVSYESSKSSHSQRASDPASVMTLCNEGETSSSPNQFPNKFSSTMLSHSQQNYGAFNFPQCSTNQFASEFPNRSNIDTTSPPKKDLLDTGLLTANTATDYKKENVFGPPEITNLACQKPNVLTLNIASPNVVANVNGMLHAEVISPQEQHSAPSNLMQCQSTVDMPMYQRQPQSQQHLSNSSSTMITGDVVKPNDGYLPSTLAVPHQQPRASSAATNKKAKRAPKEKPAKTSKRIKSSDNTNNCDVTAQITASKAGSAQNFSQFMAGPFSSEYMSMASMAQFAMANSGQMTTNSLSAMNSLSANQTMNSAYYPQASNYFNAAMSANGLYPSQYHPMNPSFYNSAAWHQYYGSYPNSTYPMPSEANVQQQSATFCTNAPTTDSSGGSVTNRGRSASTATPAIMGTAQQSIDINEQQRSLSNGGGSASTPLISPNGWSSMMPFGVTLSGQHVNAAGGSLPTSAVSAELYSSNQQQSSYHMNMNNMNMHQAYSSYSTHT